MMLGKRKHRYTDIGKDEVFRQEIEQFKYLLGPLSRIIGQIVVRVMRLTDATKQHGNDTR